MSLPLELTHHTFDEQVAAQEQVADVIADNLSAARAALNMLVIMQAWPVGARIVEDHEQHILDLKRRIDTIYETICKAT